MKGRSGRLLDQIRQRKSLEAAGLADPWPAPREHRGHYDLLRVQNQVKPARPSYPRLTQSLRQTIPGWLDLGKMALCPRGG